MPSLKGYITIVTGGNSGIGYEMALQLAIHGARVYIAARSQERMTKAIAQMKESNGEKLDLQFLNLDLQNLQSVKDAAETFMKAETSLDILINNAGIMAVPYALTPNNFETQWQTNHLAPFYFTTLLLPLLSSTAAAHPSTPSRVRVINLSSDAANAPTLLPKEGMSLQDPNLAHIKGSLPTWKRYGHSKKAVILSTRALQRRLNTKNISAYSVHPGVIDTNLQAESSKTVFGWLIYQALKVGIIGSVDAHEGALTALFCATSEGAVEGKGGYFAPFGVLDRRPERWEAGLDERVWVESERMLREAGF